MQEEVRRYGRGRDDGASAHESSSGIPHLSQRCVEDRVVHARPWNEDSSKDEAMKNPRVPRYVVTLVKERSVNVEEYGRVSNAKLAADAARVVAMEQADRELFMVVTVDTKNRIIGINVVSIGSLSASVVHPRETLKMSILQNASAIILIHNHPSGDPTPSSEDRAMTARIVKAGEIMGIKVLDSIVLGDKELGYAEYFSFQEAGMIGVQE